MGPDLLILLCASFGMRKRYDLVYPICHEKDFLGRSLGGIVVRFKSRFGRSSVVAIARRPVEGAKSRSM